MTVIKAFRPFVIDTHSELRKRRISALSMVVNICLLILPYRCYHPAMLIKQRYANLPMNFKISLSLKVNSRMQFAKGPLNCFRSIYKRFR